MADKKKEEPKKKQAESHKAEKEKPTKKAEEKVSHKAEKEKPVKNAGAKKAEKEQKPVKKAEKKEGKKDKVAKEEVKKKNSEKFKKPKRPVIKKSDEVKKLSKLVREKKRRMFRGRFGKRGSVRKISTEKWQKWRKPRGLDIYFKKEDGLVPGSGYGRPKKIRFLHPSGYAEKLVRNMQDLLLLEKEKERVAARISGTIGLKKKIEMLKKADELKIVVLNR